MDDGSEFYYGAAELNQEFDVTAPEITNYTFLYWALNGVPCYSLTDELLTELDESGHKLILTAVYSRDNALLGDVDGDGKIDIFDASAIQKSIAGMEGYTNYNALKAGDPELIIADVDNNGIVDIFDASLIQKWIAHDNSAMNYPIGQPLLT